MKLSVTTNFRLALAPILFAVVLLPGLAWAAGPTTQDCPTEPAQNVPIVSGLTYRESNCVLKSIADVDSFQFTGLAGQTWLTVLGLGANQNTQIALTILAPNSTGGSHFFQGTTCTFCVSPGPPSYAVSATLKLPVSGTYTIVVTETSNAVQPYDLSLEQINPLPADAVPLMLQQSASYQINPPTAQGVFTLNASSSSTYELVVQLAPNASTQVCLSTYDPSGKVVSSNCTCTFCVSPGPPTYSVTEYLTPPTSGTYLLLVYESHDDLTVGYSIEASCYSGACPTQTTASPVYTYYFPHLAIGGGWQTTFTYINYSPQSVSCQTTYFSDLGTPLTVPFAQGSVSSRADNLGPGASVHVQTSAGVTATTLSGWAEALCTGPIKASLLYRLYNGSVAQGEASVNASTAPATQFVTFAQSQTGVAYANPSTAPANVTITVLDTNGNTLGSTTFQLQPNQHGAANLGPLLGLTNFTGSVQITSATPIISLSINAEAFPSFSSLPPGDLPDNTLLKR